MKKKLSRLTTSVRDDLMALRERSILDSLKRYREPAAWMWLAVMAVALVVNLVTFGWQLLGEHLTVVDAAQATGTSVMNLTWMIVLFLFVWTCLFVTPSTSHALTLTLLAAILTTVGTVLTIVLTLLGLPAGASAFLVFLEFIGGLLDILLKAGCAISLIIIYRSVVRGRMDMAEPAPQPEAQPVVDDQTPEEQQPDPAADPAWRPEAARGTVWHSAQEAAAGRPGEAAPEGVSGWGIPTPGTAPKPARVDESTVGGTASGNQTGNVTTWHPASRPDSAATS